MKKNMTLLLLFLGSILSASRAGNLPEPVEGKPDSRFTIDLKWVETNAIQMKRQTTRETVNGQEVSVIEYVMTIPFFEESLKAKLDCINSPVVEAKQHIVPSVIPPPCGNSEFRLYNDHLKGRVIGSKDVSMSLRVHDFTAGVGVMNLRAEAECGDRPYGLQYFRIVVQKEKTPPVDLRLLLNEKAISPNANTRFEEEPIRFSLLGAKTGNGHMFVRVVPPCGMDCRKTDFAVDATLDSIATKNQVFYTCDMNGEYAVKLMYRAPRVGGGEFNQPVQIPGWNHYSFLHADKAETAKIAREEPGTEADKIAVFPNPVKDVLHIRLPLRDRYGISQVTVTDMAGRQVLMQETNSPQFKLNMTGFAKGAYVLKVVFEKQVFTETVIHQ